MPSSFNIVIREIGYRESFTYYVGDRFYVLSDGTKVRMPTTAAWCVDCREVVSVEQVPEIADIQYAIDEETRLNNEESSEVPDENRIDLRSLFNGLDEEGRKMFQEVFNDESRESRSHFNVLRWRKARKGPRRCLVCGGHSVRVLHELGDLRAPPPTEKTKININGEVLTFEVSHGSLFRARKGEDILYDTEGNLISAENEAL